MAWAANAADTCCDAVIVHADPLYGLVPMDPSAWMSWTFDAIPAAIERALNA